MILVPQSCPWSGSSVIASPDQPGFPFQRSPTHLDLVETPVTPDLPSAFPKDCPPPDPLSTNFRHSGWAPDRRRIYDAMLDLRLPYARRAAFAACGTSHWILRHRDDPEQFKLAADHCHDRFCVPCAASRRATVRRNLTDRLIDEPHRFLTLTIRHASEPLATLLHRLYTGFRRLRGQSLWKNRVDGGVAFLELTYDADRRAWNPHLHCMLEGRYIDLRDLSQAWLAATGDSQNVNIRYIRTPHTAIAYITKYATKPIPGSILRDPTALPEAIRVLTGRRTVITFGRWRSWRLLHETPDKHWEFFDHLNAVRDRATRDDPLCRNIVDMLDTADPVTGEFSVLVDQLPPHP